MKTLFSNARFVTMTAEGHEVEAVIVEDGKIIETGRFNDLKELADEQVSLEGKVVYPGFIDSHMHLIGHGQKISSVDLSGFTSIREILEVIHQAEPVSGWIVLEGWNDNQLMEGRAITRQDIDTVCSDYPVVLKRICRHVVAVNSKALELAGIGEDTHDVSGGVIGRTDHGELNGLFYDEAQALIIEHIPELSQDDLVDIIHTSIKDLHRMGLTGAHSEDMAYYGPYTNPLGAYRKAIDSNFRVHLLRHHHVFKDMVHESGGAFISLGNMKIFMDGSLGGHTAWLSKPYTDEPSLSGVAVHTEEQLIALTKVARTYQTGIAVHVIGDQATKVVLDVIEKHPPQNGVIDRLIHVNVLSKELIDRMKELSIMADIQPMFVPSDFPWVTDRLGKDRLTYSYAWKTLLEEGIVLAGGSDAPIENADPLLGMNAAMNNPYVPDQELTAFETISLYTTGAAAIAKEDHLYGKIASGFCADFTVVSDEITKESISHCQIEATIVNGNVVYQKEEGHV
ncbi:amidohydrolase [Chryseomicrobium palamuruense]|uniref:Amidohydrolase n=1 Tax=Chryseomicrobium palamuruense TaxID=682973 RepID=A0ABV8UV01_9BACL